MANNKQEVSKELIAIREAISSFVKNNKKRVVMHGDFLSFDEDGERKEEFIFAYGDKKSMLISIEDIKERIKKEKGDFVNW